MVAKIKSMTVGDKIRALRKERGWHQGELAERVGMKAQNISRYEKNKAIPREATLAIFADAFGVAITEFTSLAASANIPNLDPELAEYVRAIPTLDEKEQEAVKCLLKALVTAKKAQNLFAS